MGLSLRAYPTVYLTVPLRREVVEMAERVRSLVGQANPDVSRWALQGAYEQVLCRGAFADSYDLWDQMGQVPYDRYRWELDVDFVVGDHRIKLAHGSLFMKSGNTGPSTEIRLFRTTFERSNTTMVVPAVVGLPDVVYLGYLDRKDVLVHAKSNAIIIPANSTYMQRLSDVVELEQRRRRGRFV